EPLTPRSVVWCSIQLSYGRLPKAGRRCAAATTNPQWSVKARRIVVLAVAAGCWRNHIGRMGPDAIAPQESADNPPARPSVNLLPGRHRRAEGGHPWIYSKEVAMEDAAKSVAPGSLVTMRRADETPLGVAMFNPHTLLAARLLDRDAARPIGRRFLAR